MIINILKNTSQDIVTRIILVIALPIIVLVSLSLHEYAHGTVSYGLGDPTVKRLGRLTLNPLKHLNPIGTVCMLLFGFGWANPVPINPRYYKNPKKGMALCGLAGPLINIVIGIRAYVYHFVMIWLNNNPPVLNAIPCIKYVPDIVYIVLTNLLGIIGYYNVLLAIFNLIPVPPLDGSRLLYAFLPDKQYFGIMKHERIIMLVMLALLWLGFFDFFIASAYTFVYEKLGGCVSVSLDTLLQIITQR